MLKNNLDTSSTALLCNISTENSCRSIVLNVCFIFVDPQRKIDFNLRLSLISDVSWVQFPAHFELMNMPRAFAVRVDAAKLAEGAHSGVIRAYDVENVEKGPVFRIPITVVQPLTIPKTLNLPDLHYNHVLFKPNTINRHFILVPDDATWAGNFCSV